MNLDVVNFDADELCMSFDTIFGASIDSIVGASIDPELFLHAFQFRIFFLYM